MRKITVDQASILKYKDPVGKRQKSKIRVEVEQMEVGEYALFTVGEDVDNIKQIGNVVTTTNKAMPDRKYRIRTLADESGAVIHRLA